MPTKFTEATKVLNLGPLGTITALTLTPPNTTTQTCTYIGGLPYALPPVEDHRFRAPRPLPQGHRYGTALNPTSYTGRTALCPQPSWLDKSDPSTWDENCLQLNIWIPSGTKPKNGWPVLFYIHGGWLQFGSANTPAAVVGDMYRETSFRAIVVMPAYRLNLFGFLAGKELEEEAREWGEGVGNMGFWDQRVALEWTRRYVGLLGGDADNITVAGYSAGSHSTFQQLAHDLGRPEGERCIARVAMLSNGPGVKAKEVREQQKQFDELLGHLGISSTLGAKEKLQRLRAVPAQELVDTQARMNISEFRATSDGSFIDHDLTRSINDGSFARKCKARGIKIFNGECAEEWNVYGSWRTPKNDYQDVRRRLIADYPEKTVDKILPLYFPNQKLGGKFKDWRDAFGKVYADMQVYALERGLADRLCKNGMVPGKDLLRYRIEWRAKCVPLPPAWGVTHSSDMAIWFWGNGWGKGLTEGEKEVLGPWHELFSDFVAGKDVSWSTNGVKKQLVLGSDGKISVRDDELWDGGVEIWQAATREESREAKL